MGLTKYFIISVIALFLGVEIADAQSNTRINYRMLSLESGLSQSTIVAIEQDSYGFLWLGTNDGLNKYDGYGFEIYKFNRTDNTSLPNNDITDLIPLADGKLLVATGNGLGIYHPNTDDFKRISRARHGEDSVRLQSVQSLYRQSENIIWIGSEAGLVSLDLTTQEAEIIKPIEDLMIFLTDFYHDGDQLWVASSNGLHTINEETYELELFDNELLNDAYLSSIKGFKGKLWIGSVTGELFAWNPDEEKLDEHDIPESETGNKRITHIYSENDEVLWVAGNHGVMVSSSGESFTNYTFPSLGISQIANNNVNTVFIDNANNLWVGTFLNGVFVADLKPRKFHDLINRSNPKIASYSPIWSIGEYPDDVFWIGTENGLYTVDQNNEGQITLGTDIDFLTDAIVNATITMISRDLNDGLWIGTVRDGAYHYSEETGSIKHYDYDPAENTSLIDYEINDILHTDDAIWIGTVLGLNRIDRETGEIKDYVIDDNRIANRAIYSLFYVDNTNTILVGTGNGLYQIKAPDGQMERIDLDSDSQEDYQELIYSVYHDGDRFIWLGTRNGVIRFDKELQQADYFDHESEVGSNFIYSILPGSRNNIWLSTNQGLIRISNTQTEQIEDLTYRLYDSNDGLLSNEFNQGASYKSNNGELYFGNLQGVNFFSDAVLHDNSHVPEVIISGLEVLRGTEREFYPLIGKDEITLSYSDNVITIRFAVLDFTQPQKNQFEYKLEGFSENWTRGNNIDGASAIYTNLDPGNYTFLVRGSNNDGLWNYEGASLSVVIIPPFYQTTWFYIVFLLGFVGLLYGGMKYREKRFNETNEELEKIVKIRTDELRQRELLFRLISENATELIAMIDKDGKIMYASPSYEDTLGFSYDELFGRDVFSLIHPDDMKLAQLGFDDIKKTAKTQSLELRVVTKRNRYKIFRVNAASIPDEDAEGTSARIVIVCHNIDTQKQTEEALRLAKNQAEEANQAKSSFLAGMSHELRTPLNAILGFAQILKRSTSLEERERNYVDTMYSSGNHLLNMINDVLDISKIEAGRMNVLKEDFNFKVLLRDIEDMFRLQAVEKGLDFQINLSKNIPKYVYSDAGKVRQVLINLISNGIKFTDEGFVHVNIEAEYTADDNVHIEFEIVDSGRGIPDSQLENIFEPFQQISDNYSKGTGLGLAISSRLVSMMGGSLKVDSIYGKGSSFSFDLDVKPVGVPENITEITESSFVDIKGDKVWNALIVDDVEYNLTLLETLLAPLGIICHKSKNGQHALEIFESTEIDFILMDLRMPEMTGSEAMKIIRNGDRNPDIPIIAITASGFKGKKAALLKEGFDAYIRKPFREEELFLEISKTTGITFIKENEDQKIIKTKSNLKLFGEAIENLPSDVVTSLKEAIEFNDLERITTITDDLTDSDSDSMAILNKKAKNREYSFFIKLNEFLNPVE